MRDGDLDGEGAQGQASDAGQCDVHALTCLMIARVYSTRPVQSICTDESPCSLQLSTG
jgi:hypothetical protein